MRYIKSNSGFILFIILLLVINFNPSVKALLLRGVLKSGFFKPVVDKEPNTTIPDVTFRTATGEKININDLKGKVVFLNFWATWCPPCLAEMPSISALKTKLKNTEAVIFVMVDVDSNFKKSLALMKAKNYDLPVYGTESAIPSTLYTGTLPTTLIINKQGEMVLKHEGMADYDSGEIEALLKRLAE